MRCAPTLLLAHATSPASRRWDVQPYPQYAWFRSGDAVYEARLSNSEQGSYQGYPLDESEWPTWLP